MKKLTGFILAGLVVIAGISTLVFAQNNIKLNITSATMKVGESLQLKVSGTKSKPKWSTSKKTVATVTSTGLVKAKKEGSVKITATLNTKKLVCKITVKPKDITVKEVASETAKTGNKLKSDRIISELMADMTVEEKVGQMFYVRCPSTNAVSDISKYHLGGYILFGQDFKDKSKSTIVSNIKSYQKASDIPMLIGVDEEGGTVVRVSSNPALRSSPFPSPKNVFNSGGWSAIEKDAKEKADLLLSLGINVNMAPVCDVSSKDTFMYDRSFSDDVSKVNTFVKKTVKISKNKKFGTVLKHFPGYGNNVDTHTGIAIDNRKYSQFEKTDFKPFKAGIDSGADCILVAHNIVNCMDKNYPASLSKKVHNIIRNDLDFDGVIMTDDLAMSAISEYTGKDTAAVFAVKAGNDVLCCSDVSVQYPAVLKAVKNGDITMKQVNASVKRILKWKYNLGLLK